MRKRQIVGLATLCGPRGLALRVLQPPLDLYGRLEGSRVAVLGAERARKDSQPAKGSAFHGISRAEPLAGSPTGDLQGVDGGLRVLAGAGSVLAISQDVTGYLWLGTNRGLVRFDGFRSSSAGVAMASRRFLAPRSGRSSAPATATCG
jgi:ligand-binding sensor domain-containing protein